MRVKLEVPTMTPVDWGKMATGAAVSASVGYVVGCVIKGNVPNNLTLIKKVGVIVGAWTLSHIAGDAASKYAEDSIDSVVETVNEVKEELKKQANAASK